MNWFKKLIGGADDKEVAPRSLDHPKDLQIGDVIKFGFCGLDDLSNVNAVVKEVNSYDLNSAQRKTVFTLDAAGHLYFMAVRNERGAESIEIARLILPPVVDQLFGFDQFAKIIESDSVDGELKRKTEPGEIVGWTAASYFQEAYNEAYFHAGDYREKLLPSSKDNCSAFDYYLLVSQDRKHALQIEVYEGSRTDVLLLAYLPVRAIEELWPAKQS